MYFHSRKDLLAVDRVLFMEMLSKKQSPDMSPREKKSGLLKSNQTLLILKSYPFSIPTSFCSNPFCTRTDGAHLNFADWSCVVCADGELSARCCCFEFSSLKRPHRRPSLGSTTRTTKWAQNYSSCSTVSSLIKWHRVDILPQFKKKKDTTRTRTHVRTDLKTSVDCARRRVLLFFEKLNTILFCRVLLGSKIK